LKYRRMPRWVGGEHRETGPIMFPGEHVDIHPGDTLVFDGGRTGVVNGVDHMDSGTRVIMGQSPHRGPPKKAKREVQELTKDDIATMKLAGDGLDS